MKKYTSFGFKNLKNESEGFCRNGHWSKEAVINFLKKRASSGQVVKIEQGQFGFKSWQNGGEIAFEIKI